MAPALIACTHCGCHAKSFETSCPSCGAELRRKDGAVPRTAVAVLLGLTAATVMAGSTFSCSAYGVAGTVGGFNGTGGYAGAAGAGGKSTVSAGGNGTAGAGGTGSETTGAGGNDGG